MAALGGATRARPRRRGPGGWRVARGAGLVVPRRAGVRCQIAPGQQSRVHWAPFVSPSLQSSASLFHANSILPPCLAPAYLHVLQSKRKQVTSSSCLFHRGDRSSHPVAVSFDSLHSRRAVPSSDFSCVLQAALATTEAAPSHVVTTAPNSLSPLPAETAAAPPYSPPASRQTHSQRPAWICLSRASLHVSSTQVHSRGASTMQRALQHA